MSLYLIFILVLGRTYNTKNGVCYPLGTGARVMYTIMSQVIPQFHHWIGIYNMKSFLYQYFGRDCIVSLGLSIFSVGQISHRLLIWCSVPENFVRHAAIVGVVCKCLCAIAIYRFRRLGRTDGAKLIVNILGKRYSTSNKIVDLLVPKPRRIDPEIRAVLWLIFFYLACWFHPVGLRTEFDGISRKGCMYSYVEFHIFERLLLFIPSHTKQFCDIIKYISTDGVSVHMNPFYLGLQTGSCFIFGKDSFRGFKTVMEPIDWIKNVISSVSLTIARKRVTKGKMIWLHWWRWVMSWLIIDKFPSKTVSRSNEGFDKWNNGFIGLDPAVVLVS